MNTAEDIVKDYIEFETREGVTLLRYDGATYLAGELEVDDLFAEFRRERASSIVPDLAYAESFLRRLKGPIAVAWASSNQARAARFRGILAPRGNGLRALVNSAAIAGLIGDRGMFQ